MRQPWWAGRYIGASRTRTSRTHEASIVAAAGREDRCRIVHLSIQRSHIHLLIEACDRKALASGVRAFAISAAKVPGRGPE
jgi:REP element-mobilizing transposase RayT